MGIKRLREYIEMIEDYIEEPHSINRDWVELLMYARELINEQIKKELTEANDKTK